MTEEKKKGLLAKLFDKIDKNLKKKAEQTESSCCDSGDPCCSPKDDDKGKGSCCS